MLFDAAFEVEDHGGAGGGVVLGPGWEMRGGGGLAEDKGAPCGVHGVGETLGGGIGGRGLVEFVPDEGEVFGVEGLVGHAAGGGGEVEAVHPGGAAGAGVGVGEADGGDPVLFSGDGADAALVCGHVGVEAGVVGEDFVEAVEGEVAEVTLERVGGGVGAEEEGALVAVGAEEEAFAFGRACDDEGDEGDGALGEEAIWADLGAEGEVDVGLGDYALLGLDEVAGGCGEEIVEGGGGCGVVATPETAEGVGYVGGLCGGEDAFAAAALGDGGVEEGLGFGESHEGGGGFGTGGLATDGDAGGVAAEGGDVLLDPVKGLDEIAEGVVGGVGEVGAEKRAEVHEAEDAEAVGDGDEDDAFVGEGGAVEDGREGLPAGVAAAVNPDEDGMRAGGGGGPEVEVEAVFALWDVGGAGLHGGGGEAGGVADAGPGLGRLRWAEAERADRGLGEGDAAEVADGVA